MLLKTALLFQLITFTSCVPFMNLEHVDGFPEPKPAGERISTAMLSAVKYMRDNYRQLNLDAITGLRMVEATLKQLKPGNEKMSMNALLSLVEGTIDLALPEVAAYDASYYNKLKRLADEDLWLAVVRTNKVDRDKYDVSFIRKLLELLELSDIEGGERNGDTELFDEDISDRCIEEILDNTCNVSRNCVDLMTTPDVGGYSATHQLYYFLILSQSKCIEDKSSLDVIRTAQEEICTTIYTEMESEPVDSDIQQDLFMEQVGLCGLAGYHRQFSRDDWVERILQWQKPSGCYGSADNFLSELLLLDKSQRFRRSLHRREKREERLMSDGCLCHRTTVALMALVQNYKSSVEQ